MISVIIPVYKSEKTLERCIESLKRQTCGEIEIIMVVDGPPDASGILAERLACTDQRIRVVNQQNLGVSAARNAGIEAAKGEYIQFVDSDDYVAEGLCETLLRQISASGADLALCGFHHLYFGRDVVKLPAVSGCMDIQDGEAEGWLLRLYQDGFLNMPWNKLYKKELMEEGFRRDMDLGEDLLFNMAYLRRCTRVTAVKEALCYYIQDDRGTTLSTKKRENRMENALFLYHSMIEFCKELYGNEGVAGILESRLMAEFLDEMEGLAFANGMKGKEKREIIRRFHGGYQQIGHKDRIHLELADYRIIFFAFRRKWIWAAFCLVELRGIAVWLLRQGRPPEKT